MSERELREALAGVSNSIFVGFIILAIATCASRPRVIVNVPTTAEQAATPTQEEK